MKKMLEKHILYQAIDKLTDAHGGKTVHISPQMARALLIELERLPHLKLYLEGWGKGKG